MIARIFVTGIPKNSNARSQWARFAAARDRKTYRTRAAALGRTLVEDHGWEPAPFTTITARHVSPVSRRRDPLGLAERLKGPSDGLVDAGAIPDDDEKHIQIRLARSIRGIPAGIELTIVQE